MLTRIYLNTYRVYSKIITGKMSKNKGKVGKIVAKTMNTSNKEESKDSAISMSKNGEIILRIHAKPNAKTTRIIGAIIY
ncbi:Uncharacterized protein BM_BM6092 [Brugia malayi]|uniref:Bm6092, isoform c n=1 Tax=Brugia malayi TaxID=6279 RepID=A0A0K0JLN2_BRUMA|nr:Uncharacterized protein BM_BM6092 [Brugia malayi]CDQ01822.1 Bm6092, isoform c [Brugia malayi]VIO97018.1 Uncharacterized protein BM_BM6092 [Brugia malayi]